MPKATSKSPRKPRFRSTIGRALYKKLEQDNADLDATNRRLEHENMELRAQLSAANSRAVSEKKWRPSQVRVGVEIISEEKDFRFQHALVQPGRYLFQIERTDDGDRRETVITHTQYRAGTCIVFAAAGKILTIIYPEDLAFLRTLIVHPLLAVLPEPIDPFSPKKPTE